jgi:putative Flp pilus-assembly TadE/G-like protein
VSRRDDGAFLPMVAVMLLALFLMVGLAVDGGGKMRAQMHADNIAAEAARAAGQAIDVPQAVAGTADVVDTQLATNAADAYLKNAGVVGTVIVLPSGREITVIVEITYQTKFLDLIHIDSWTETGSATAELVTE